MRDQLLRRRVVDRGVAGDVAARIERERVRRLRDADGAGVTETTLASEPDPVTHMTDSKVTGIVKAASMTAITPSLHSQEANEGRNECVKYSFGRERIAPPCLAFSQSFFSCFQKTLARITIRTTAPAAMRIVRRGSSETLPRLSVNDPGTDRKR